MSNDIKPIKQNKEVESSSKRLVIEVIYQAVHDLKSKDRSLRIDAMNYIKSKSLDFHCNLVGFNAESFREKLTEK